MHIHTHVHVHVHLYILSLTQDEYYVTHQCFLTNRALYLLVWKVTDKEHGIEGLSVWLRNLHVSLN